jgi:uncharacterized protein YukE
VGALTPADVKRWDVNAIHAVFQTASGRATTMQQLGDNLGQVHGVLADWEGEAGEAFRADLGKARRDIEADGAESRQVAAAVSRAEADVRACKAELDNIVRAAEGYGWTITPDWRIDVGNTGIGVDPISFAAAQQALQAELDSCKAHAHAADHELASAIRGAVGDIPLDAGAQPPGGGGPPGPPKPGPGTPPSLQDMLLGAGADGDDPARTPQSLDDMLMPAGAIPGAPGYKPPSLKDMLMGGGEPADQQPQPGSLPDLLSRLPQPGATGALPPQLKPAEIESAKAMLRPILARDGVPPDQIEAQLDQYVANAQQWMANGGPHYMPPDPPAQPPPGFGEGFGDRWFAAEQQIKDLTGQNGLSALGESWGGMAKGLVQKAEEFAVQGPVVSGINDLTREFHNFLDSPSAAYYAGQKGADGAMTLPGMLFGGEGAAVEAGLGDIGPGVLETGPAASQYAAIGLDHPVTYNPWAEQAAFDLNYAQLHGGPTLGLSQQLADMSTHYIGDNPDRVVLGKFQGQDHGYIGEARENGGIYYDTSNPVWDAVGQGLSKGEAEDLGWVVNERFLQTQMENGVSRIDYVVDPRGLSSVEDVVRIDPQSFSAREIRYLTENAPAYGYERIGNSWVRVNGG